MHSLRALYILLGRYIYKKSEYNIKCSFGKQQNLDYILVLVKMEISTFDSQYSRVFGES